MQFIYLYLISVPVFTAIDFLWLGFIARGMYQSQLGHLLGPVNWPAAIAFYLIFLVGLTFFAIYPAYMNGTVYAALLMGALFGFFAYATYDLTNLATLKDWPFVLSLIDIAWGTLLGGSVSAITFLIAKSILG